MSKGGNTTTTSTSSSLPDQIAPFYTDLLSRAKTASNQPYTPYNNQRLADFSPDTQTAFGDIRTQAAGGGASGLPGINAAQTAAQGLTGFQAQGIPGTDLTPYENPYTTQVLDVQKKNALQDFQEQQAGRDASAVQAGAFGGDRRFVSDSLAQRDLNNQLQNIDATGLSNAFNSATNLFQNDQTNRLNAANLGLNAASILGTLSQNKNQMGLDNAQALSAVGSKVQQQQQAGLDIAHQDFENQQNWPNQQLSLYSQLLSGTPIKADTTTATTTPAPDFLSQLLGLGTSGAGLAKLLSGT